jgi:hypothetical protein
MWLFAHLGLTVGAAALLAQGARLEGRDRPLVLHYPFLALGAVGPDVDKLLNLALAHSMDRWALHILWLPLGLLGLGLLRWRRHGGSHLLQLAVAWLGHLFLDGMWYTPQLLLWPIYGWALPAEPLDLPGFLHYMLGSLSRDPRHFLPEAAGAGVLLAMMAYALARWLRQQRQRAS